MIAVVLNICPSDAAAGTIDSELAWPLCGRISEAPPAGWIAGDGCPADRFNNPDYSDFPLNATYGPRILSSVGYAYDFHQGIDIATPVGTPIFAVAKGTVRTAGNHSSYNDPLIALRHYSPGFWGSCKSGGGCHHTYYLHISSWVVAVGDTVEKGQLIGFTGESSSGNFAHLHFEIRKAPEWDTSSSWNRDTVHPLSLLAYHSNMSDTMVTIENVDTADAGAPIVDVRTIQSVGFKTWDVVRVEVEIYDNSTGARVLQTGETPDVNGYHVHPPWFDMELRNFEYAHKNSSKFPWSSFDDCPYVGDHGASYSSDTHLGQTEPFDEQVGLFNGIRTEIASYSHDDQDYDMSLQFQALTGTADGNNLCVKARAVNAKGASTSYATWNCTMP